MKRIVISLFILFLLLPIRCKANEKELVTLSSCIDGDTARFIMNKKEIKIRFLAIDTPEITSNQKYSYEAKEFTCDLLNNAHKIYLEFDGNSEKQDKYNRYLAWIWVDDKLLQEELVSNGLAKVAYLYDDYKYTNLLKNAQNKAKANNLNIWYKEPNKMITNETNIILIIVSIIIIISIFKKVILKKK